MILKKAMIACGVMGLMYGGSALAAGSLICAAYAFCNATSQECNMVGEINNSFYRYQTYFYENISFFASFTDASSQDISSGEVLCNFVNKNDSSFAAFQSRANIKLYPDTTAKNKWIIDDDSAICSSNNESVSNDDCPLTTNSSLKLMRIN